MSHRRLARISVVFLVATLLCAPTWAMPGRSSSEAHLFDIVARLWGSFTAVWSQEGCKLDPNGICTEASASTTDEGCALDPHGGCTEASTPTTDHGCMIDPYGVCTPGS